MSKSQKLGKKTIASTAKRKIRIMIVDDEQDVLVILRRMLEGNDYLIDTFSDSEECLSGFRPGYYDLLILDIRMPGMNGFDLYEKIRGLDSNVKICFLTAFETYRDDFKKQFPILDEIKCFIKKPISSSALIKKIETVLELQ